MVDASTDASADASVSATTNVVDSVDTAVSVGTTNLANEWDFWLVEPFDLTDAKLSPTGGVEAEVDTAVDIDVESDVDAALEADFFALDCLAEPGLDFAFALELDFCAGIL